MSNGRNVSRRGFIGAAAAAMSFVYLPGVGRVQARPHMDIRADDYSGRLCYNENPLGPSPAALAALQDAATLAHRYGDWYNSGIESQIGAMLGLSGSNICAGAGATEVIRLVADAFLGPGDEMITADPSYTQMASEANANGASVVYVPLDGDHNIDLSAMMAAIGPSTTLVSLVNPNNPIAKVFDKTDMENFIDNLPGGVVVVVDEAYHDYVHSPDYESCLRYIGAGEPVVVIRTLSKVYGLAGARIGYAAASSEYAGMIGGSQQWGTISRPSQAAAEAALGDSQHVTDTVALNDQAKAMLVAGFTSLGLDYIPSETSFMMFDTGTDANSVRSQLGSLGYQVRTGWGMPQHIRVSTGTLTEIQGFLDALESILTVGVPETSPVVPAFALYPAYPNPFNAHCQLKVVLPADEPASLSIYDLQGRKIRSLINRPLSAGTHTVDWDGKDYAGRTVASGTYVLNLIQGEYATSGQVSFVK